MFWVKKRRFILSGKFILGLQGVTVLLLFASLSACGLVGTPRAPTPFPDTAYTAAAQTIIAQFTETALAAPPTLATPTETPAPPVTTPPAESPTVEATETPEPTEKPEVEATPTATAEPEATPVSEATPPGRLVFEDDFSDESMWFTDRGENFGFEYARGGYRIYVNILNATIWSIRERDFADVRLEVDGQRTAGARDGYYGLVCRHQDDEESYYALVIAEDGTFGIGKSEEGEFEFLETGVAAPGVIRSGNGPNRVRADCLGDRLSLYANGQKLLEVRDDDFDSGYVGLAAGTRLSGAVTVLFDNFAIYEP